MSKIDTQTAHKFFSANFFNNTWTFIDKETRTDIENEDMILHAMGSLLHWKLRGDATDTNMSISYWQISRVYSLAQNAQEAKHYGHKCLEVSKDGKTPPFYLAYGYEAIALANFVAGDNEEATKNLNLAYKEAENITIADNKSMILVDLDALKAKLS